MKNVNINVRVEESLYKEIKNADINISDIVRKALAEEMKKKRLELIKREMEIASPAIKRIGIKQIVKDIREMRENR